MNCRLLPWYACMYMCDFVNLVVWTRFGGLGAIGGGPFRRLFAIIVARGGRAGLKCLLGGTIKEKATWGGGRYLVFGCPTETQQWAKKGHVPSHRLPRAQLPSFARKGTGQEARKRVFFPRWPAATAGQRCHRTSYSPEDPLHALLVGENPLYIFFFSLNFARTERSRRGIADEVLSAVENAIYPPFASTYATTPTPPPPPFFLRTPAG